jgi:hypothetical protein
MGFLLDETLAVIRVHIIDVLHEDMLLLTVKLIHFYSVEHSFCNNFLFCLSHEFFMHFLDPKLVLAD